jgi:AraC-like DNA-binding protein
MDMYARELLSKVKTQDNLPGKIQHLLIQEMPEKPFTASETAGQLGLSERSLYRELQQQGTSFRQLRDQALSQKARQLLSNQNVSIAEVAFLLGFSENAAFYRAFKRWTGRTPLDYRKSG